MYGEDSAYCYKLKMAGYDNYVIYKSLIYHKVSTSTGVGSLFSTYYIYRNRILFVILNYVGLNKLIGVASNILQCIIRFIQFLSTGKKQHARIMIYAIKDRKIKGRSKREL